MKKILKVWALIVSCVLLFSNITYASTNTQVVLDKQSTQMISINYTQNELTQIRKIHNIVVKKGLYTLNNDGTITINTDATSLKVNERIFEEYIQSIDNLNDIINLGVAFFDDKLELKTKSSEEISNIINKRDKKLWQDGKISNNRFDTYIDIHTMDSVSKLLLESITPYYSDLKLPRLYAYSIAKNNKATIKNYMSTLMIYCPSSAYSSTVGYWVGNVMEGGDWDYKVVPGYSPYNKEWSAVQRYTISDKTSEWFGNYNFDFTGRYLFSLNILLAGGDGVSLFFHHTMDDYQDKVDVTQGYNESSGV